MEIKLARMTVIITSGVNGIDFTIQNDGLKINNKFSLGMKNEYPTELWNANTSSAHQTHQNKTDIEVIDKYKGREIVGEINTKT